MGSQKLLQDYCSCVFQVKGKGKKAYSPYAVCAKSVYQGKGKAGPGAVACRFAKKVLDSYDLDTLRGWLVFEGVKTVKEAKKLDKIKAVNLIHSYLQKEPKTKVRKVYVKRRSPKVKRKSPQVVRRKTMQR